MALIAKRHGGTSLMIVTLIGCTVSMRALGARLPARSLEPIPAGVRIRRGRFSRRGPWLAARRGRFLSRRRLQPSARRQYRLFAACPSAFPDRRRLADPDRDPRRITWLNSDAHSCRSMVQAAIGDGGGAFPDVASSAARTGHAFSGEHLKGHRVLPTSASGTAPMLEGLRVVFGQFWILPEWVAGPARANPFSG